MKPFKGQFKATPKGLTLMEIMAYFSSEEKARLHLESINWPNGPVCPKCGTNDQARISKLTGESVRPGLYCCKDCRRQFTVTIGTIFEDSHIPLNKWLVAFYLLCSSKKGISSLQLQRMLDLGSYKSALFMTHRIRHAMKDYTFDNQLSGPVECDETVVGGKPRFIPSDGKTPAYNKISQKSTVFTMLERGGSKRSFVVKNVTGKNLKTLIKTHVAGDAVVNTDESRLYNGLKFPVAGHKKINHEAKEYARREADGSLTTTNGVESSFSLLKRGIVGTFHHVSANHLHRYVAEFDFRWNTRHDSDTERTTDALRKAKGKRLQYEPTRYRRKKAE